MRDKKRSTYSSAPLISVGDDRELMVRRSEIDQGLLLVGVLAGDGSLVGDLHLSEGAARDLVGKLTDSLGAEVVSEEARIRADERDRIMVNAVTAARDLDAFMRGYFGDDGVAS